MLTCIEIVCKALKPQHEKPQKTWINPQVALFVRLFLIFHWAHRKMRKIMFRTKKLLYIKVATFTTIIVKSWFDQSLESENVLCN